MYLKGMQLDEKTSTMGLLEEVEMVELGKGKEIKSERTSNNFNLGYIKEIEAYIKAGGTCKNKIALSLIKMIRNAATSPNKNEIWGFYEEEYPFYTQGDKAHTELSSLATAEEVNGLVERIKGLEQLERVR